MVLIRHLVLCCPRHNILFRSKHVLGVLNRECDLLSHLQVEKFMNLASRADEQPTAVPQHPGELVEHLKLLLHSAISQGSHRTYQRAWTVYAKFAQQCVSVDALVFPLSVNSVARFIAHLSARQFAPSTISTYISALSYVHKLHGHADPTKAFLILKLLSAIKSRSRHVTKTSVFSLTKEKLLWLDLPLQLLSITVRGVHVISTFYDKPVAVIVPFRL